MARVQIRTAAVADAPTVAGFVRSLVEEMAALGGPRPSGSPAAWAELARTHADRLADPTFCYLLAEDDGAALGLCAAQIVVPGPLFVPTRSLHVSVVYVAPAARRRGLARRLLEAALTWGREAGCVEADLHTLVHNPARALYERLGFSTTELEMRRPL